MGTTCTANTANRSTILKSKLWTNKNIEAIGEQLEALKKDVITRRITADAAKENTKTLGERLIKEMEVKGQELELKEKKWY